MATLHAPFPHFDPRSLRQMLRSAGVVAMELIGVHGQRVGHWLDRRQQTEARKAAQRQREVEWLKSELADAAKADVVALLGPPPTAAQVTVLPESDSAALAADAWYYPFDSADRSVLAVFFDEDQVAVVDVIKAPKALWLNN